MDDHPRLYNYEKTDIEKAVQKLSCIDFSNPKAIDYLQNEIVDAIDQNHEQHKESHEIILEPDIVVCNCEEFYKKEHFFILFMEMIKKFKNEK